MDGADGQDGADGADLTLVENEACLVCHGSGDLADVGAVHVGALEAIDPTDDLEILAVNFDNSGGVITASIDFAYSVGYYDGFGNKTLVNPFTPRSSNPAQLDYIRFFLAKLVPGTDGSPDTWDEYAAGERNVANLVDNFDGTYTYTFSGDFAADYDASATHRAGIQLYHLDGFKVINPLYDFVPAGGTPASHEVVNIDSCNECHGSFGIHGGGRVETGMCVMCHNENRPLVDLPILIHKIHTAQMVDDHDFTEVTYPQDPRNCTKCHDGADANTPEGDNWKDVPNRKACGACHTDIDWVTGANHGGGAQASDLNCSGCHAPSAIETAHLTSDSTPNNPGVPAGVPVMAYELLEARASGTSVEVDFAIKRDGTALDITALPSDLTSGGRYPSFLLPYALPQGGIDAPADYNNLGNEGGLASSVSLEDLITAGSVSDGAVAGDGVYTATIADAYPAGATLRAVGLQSYFRITVGGTEYSLHTPSEIIAVEGDVGRRMVVDSDKCANCHDSLMLHGGSRVHNVQLCVACHTPNLSSSGRAADPSTLPADTVTALGDDPLVFPEESMQLKNLVHAAHGGEVREAVFDFVRNRNGGLYYDFSEITFPGILQNCETCHLPGTYEADLPAGVLPTTDVTTSGGNATRDDIIAARESVPNSTDLASSPLAATCYGCHASQPVEAHIESNGGIIAEPRAGAGLNQ